MWKNNINIEGRGRNLSSPISSPNRLGKHLHLNNSFKKFSFYYSCLKKNKQLLPTLKGCAKPNPTLLSNSINRFGVARIGFVNSSKKIQNCNGRGSDSLFLPKVLKKKLIARVGCQPLGGGEGFGFGLALPSPTKQFLNYKKNFGYNKTKNLNPLKNICFSSSLLNNAPDSLAEEKWYTSYSKFSEINVIKVKFINPTFVRFSCRKFLPNGKIIGRVENANTLHYKTLKPLKGGLFCEAIFGPVKDFVCACGKVGKFKDNKKNSFHSNIQSSKIKVSKKKYCPDCDVEYTWSVIRRYQLGYIGLGSPVTHVWYIKGNPSYISILLDMKKRHLEYINYGSETLTLENSIKKGIGTNIALTANEIISSWKKSQESLKFNNNKLLWSSNEKTNQYIGTEKEKEKDKDKDKDMKSFKNFLEKKEFYKSEDAAFPRIPLAQPVKVGIIFSKLLENKVLPTSASCAMNFSKFFSSPNPKVSQTSLKEEKSYFSDYKIKKKNSKSLNPHSKNQIKNLELTFKNKISSEQKKTQKLDLTTFNQINKWGNKIHLAHKKLATSPYKKSHLLNFNNSSFCHGPAFGVRQEMNQPNVSITSENRDIKLGTIFSKYLFSKKEKKNFKLSPTTTNLFNMRMSQKEFFKKLTIPFYLLLTFEFLLFKNRTFAKQAQPFGLGGALPRPKGLGKASVTGYGKSWMKQEKRDQNRYNISPNSSKESFNPNNIKIQNKIVKITYKYLFKKIIKKKNLIFSKFIENDQFVMSQKTNLEFFRDFMNLTSLTLKKNNEFFNSPKKIFFSESFASIFNTNNMNQKLLDNCDLSQLNFFNFNFKNFEILKKTNSIINFEKKIGWISSFGQKKIFYLFLNSKNLKKLKAKQALPLVWRCLGKDTTDLNDFLKKQKTTKSISIEEQKISSQNKQTNKQAIKTLDINKKSFKNGVIKDNFNTFFPILSSFLDLKSNIKFHLEVLGNLFLNKNKLLLKIVKKWSNKLVRVIIKHKLERFQSERQRKKQSIYNNVLPNSQTNLTLQPCQAQPNGGGLGGALFGFGNFTFKNQIYSVQKYQTSYVAKQTQPFGGGAGLGFARPKELDKHLISIIKKMVFLMFEISDHLKISSIEFNEINTEKNCINKTLLFNLQKNNMAKTKGLVLKDTLLNNIFSSKLFSFNFLIEKINNPSKFALKSFNENSVSVNSSKPNLTDSLKVGQKLKNENSNKIMFLVNQNHNAKRKHFDIFNSSADELSETDYILGFKSKNVMKKVNHNNQLIAFEGLIKKLSDKEKKLSNNIYTLSYRERWEMDKDWNIYRLYNIPETNFSDIVNPIYQKRLWQLDHNRFSFPISKVRFVPSYNSNEYKIFKKVNNFISFWKNSVYYQINYRKMCRSSNLPQATPSQGGGPRVGKTFRRVRGKAKTHLPLKEMNFSHRITKAVFSGPGVINELLNEFTLDELIKMDLQNTFILYVLNKKIMKLKSAYIKQKLKVNKVLKVLNEGLNKNQKKINISKSTAKNLKPFEMMDKQFKELYKKRELLIRRTKLVRQFERNLSDPRFMMIRLLPVLPPDLRPIIKIGNQIAASDLNRLYQRVIYRNERLKKFLLDSATSSSYEIKYVQRLVQEAVDNLISNGKSGVTPEKDSRGRLLKSLSDNLKGKEGRFRQYLLGKRIDYSGRSVIVVGPTLKLHECGIPKEMALELYLPFLLKTILNQNLTRTVIGAKTLIKKNPTLAWELLREVMLSSPVLLNRAPTLHRLGIQAFQPKLVDGRAILLHPLVCSAFNADFDGDQMAVHIPITIEARAEAWKLMLSRNNLLSPATGEPLAIPSQDMVLGCYYLTTNCSEKNIKYKKGSGSYFLSFQDVIKSYQNKELDLHSIIWVKCSLGDIIENGNDQEEPLEIRLNSYGHFIEIYSKSQKFYDQRKNLISQYIATTPGKVLFNLMIQKSIDPCPGPPGPL